jgi:phosphomannomutase
MLGDLAAIRGAHHEVTLTGFKWIANAGLSLETHGKGRFVFGFEEALGYTIGTTVRDKDGISAALVFCDLVAGLHAEGRDVLDRLSELWQEVGLWVSAQHSIVRPGTDGPVAIQHAMTRLADNPPSTVGTYIVERVVDYRHGAETRPFWLGAQALIELSLGAAGRVLIRPSGTEPKLKIYVDLRNEAGPDPHQRHSALTQEAKGLAAEMGRSLGL